jgi:hypothetical protein
MLVTGAGRGGRERGSRSCGDPDGRFLQKAVWRPSGRGAGCSVVHRCMARPKSSPVRDGGPSRANFGVQRSWVGCRPRAVGPLTHAPVCGWAVACLGAPAALQSPVCASQGANLGWRLHLRRRWRYGQQPRESNLGCPEFQQLIRAVAGHNPSSEPAHTEPPKPWALNPEPQTINPKP